LSISRGGPENRFDAMRKFEAVVMGASSGGWEVLSEIFQVMAGDFSLPIIVAQHLHPLQNVSSWDFLGARCALTCKEAEEKEPIAAGYIYFAPANYHLLIEKDRTFSLSVDERVNFSRPSIDVLFESAAEAYGAGLIGVVLSGANRDGADGLKRIKDCHGLAIVQDPATAQTEYMPRAAIAATAVDQILAPSAIGHFLSTL